MDGVSFTMEPEDQLVALVGPSGGQDHHHLSPAPALRPTSGRITLDGHDLRDIRLESLSEQIGMVTQETYLFHDTIRANLLYAKQDATDAELEAACRAANIHAMIAALPDGYDTMVGERGYRLSGGEKQRLALARVILKDRASWCWTKPRHTWTPRARRSSRPRWSRSSTGAPVWSSRTGCPPSSRPTRSWSWSRGIWWSRAPTPNCWPAAVCTRNCITRSLAASWKLWPQIDDSYRKLYY
ncbi:MAG: ATP-binding cassette domain-containing protein [Caldilineaceae bacterium]